MAKILRFLSLAALLVFAGLFFSQKILFINADLGRHIKNGAVLLEQGKLIASNYYSYTEPLLPVINHHWGSGVIFYLVWRLFGFGGLSILHILIYLGALLLFFKVARNASGFKYAVFFSIISIPLISFRKEIRPEAFSCLLMGLYYYLLALFEKDKVSFKVLSLFVIFSQVLWVNLHIFFVFGPFLIGAFWVGSLFDPQKRKFSGRYVILLAAAALACVLNPFGVKGALEPFMILREYGYMIAENQSVLFMRARFYKEAAYTYFIVIFFFTLLTFIPVLLKKDRRESVASFIIMFFLSVFGWRMIRGMPIFGFFFIPFASANVFKIIKDSPYRIRRASTRRAITALAILIPAVFFLSNARYSPFNGVFGIGPYPEVNLSAEFFKDNNIKGPIFNNYDIGGYLIFHLFPEHKVFVDNRPEAYSVSFFKQVYEPMQASEDKWHEMDGKYGFNCIYFFRHDNTTHAQPFLVNRIKDPEWAPVFVDNYSIILLKRNEANRALIEVYELPKYIFGIR